VVAEIRTIEIGTTEADDVRGTPGITPNKLGGDSLGTGLFGDQRRIIIINGQKNHFGRCSFDFRQLSGEIAVAGGVSFECDDFATVLLEGFFKQGCLSCGSFRSDIVKHGDEAAAYGDEHDGHETSFPCN